MSAVTDSGDAPIYERSVYQCPHVESGAKPGENKGGSNDDSIDENVLAGSGKPPDGNASFVYHRVVPESFEGRYGLFWRLTAIVGFTLGLLIATLLGLAIFGELSELLQ